MNRGTSAGRVDGGENTMAMLRQSRALQEQLSARPVERDASGSSADASAEERIQHPLADYDIGSRFGPRRHPILGVVRDHHGLDIGAPMRTPITAAMSGKVILAATLGGYGRTTIVAHRNGLTTLYAHQSQLLRPEGSSVAQGEVLGLVGSTGLSTGPHLHFETRVDGIPVDPFSLEHDLGEVT